MRSLAGLVFGAVSRNARLMARRRRVVVPLMALLAAGLLGSAHPVNADSVSRSAATASVTSGQRLVNIDLTLFRFPAIVRVSSGACDASPDDAVVVEGRIGGPLDGTKESTLLPVGRAATQLAAGSPINAIASVQIVTGVLENTNLRFVAFDLFVQLYRESGFPGVTSFNVCLV